MAEILDRPITADTTRITADRSRYRPTTRMRRFLWSLLPSDWSADADGAPILDALLAGPANLLTFVRSFIAYAKLQTRIATATGLFLDLASTDFFGIRMPRRTGEADPAFSARIRAEVLRPRATRQAISDAVTNLTGIAPDILEPFNPGDCGAYGSGTMAYGGAVAVQPVLTGYGAALGGYGVGAIAYGQPIGVSGTGGGAGAYGSLSLPNQIFVTVHRPAATFPDLNGVGGYGTGFLAYGGGRDGVPSLGGYGAGIGAYGVPSRLSYGIPPPPYVYFPGAGAYQAQPDLVSISDDQINEAIASTVAAGVTAWTRIQGP